MDRYSMSPQCSTFPVYGRHIAVMNPTFRRSARQAESDNFETKSPREWAREMQLRPHVARALLIGRRPWDIQGRPVVVEGRRG